MNDVVFTEILFCDNIRRIELPKSIRCEGAHKKKMFIFKTKDFLNFFFTMKLLAMLL